MTKELEKTQSNYHWRNRRHLPSNLLKSRIFEILYLLMRILFYFLLFLNNGLHKEL